MKKKNLERILNFIREEMMTTGSNVNTAGFSSKAPAKGPTAGYDPVIGKKKRYIYQRGVRKNWMKKDESK
tara:strand:+ start:206 stop:415 length:210 start_codon:yes stop_codon:yes gene_type:complete